MENDNQLLVEKWDELLEASTDRMSAVTNPEDKAMMARLLENQEKWILENQTAAADLGVFTPILVPTVRRIFPALVANQIVGVQPMSTPTGYAFAWRASYAGTDGNKISAAVNPLHRGLTENSIQGPQFVSVVITLISGTAVVLGEKVWKTSGGTNVHGLVKYFETTDGDMKVLVEYDISGDANPDSGATITNLFVVGNDVFFNGANTTNIAVTGLFNNESGFNTILRDYAGPNSTAVGEKIGDSTDFPVMRVAMERVTVEAQTRKLRAEYTLEMAQDLKAVHNMDAEAELMNVLQYEIAAEIDRDLIAAIKDNATDTTNWSYGILGASQTDTLGFADGQWEIEKLRTLYTRILKESNRIAVTSRRGAGNFIIASVNVISALEGLNNFMYSQVPNDVGPVGGVTRVGTLDGRFAVYVDTFWVGMDYCLVGYKGPGVMDTGVVYCPYIPIMMQKITHENTFQPAIGVLTRSAIAYNLFGTNNYYRKFDVDFTTSQLGAVAV